MNYFVLQVKPIKEEISSMVVRLKIGLNHKPPNCAEDKWGAADHFLFAFGFLAEGTF